MAYCVKCGAYIPDGQTVCLACGYDPAAEQKKQEQNRRQKQARAGSAAQQYSRNNEEMRRRLDEQRRKAQEKNRQWAEQERQRREEQAAREAARREQQERDRQWAQEEYERRQAEQRQADWTEYSGQQAGEGNKALAAMSYLSVLFAVPYIFTPNDEYAKFHAKQGLKLFVFGILADILTGFIGLGWIVTLARLYLIYKGMSNALNGKKEPLPYIGTIGE